MTQLLSPEELNVIGMSNDYLHTLIKKRLKVKSCLGVYAVDECPPMKNQQTVILNTDPSDRPGKHFIALYKVASNTILFDSASNSLELYPLFSVILSKKGLSPQHRIPLQPIQDLSSNFCGFFCLDYIMLVDLKLRQRLEGIEDKHYETDESKLHMNDFTVYSNCLSKIKHYV